MSPGVFRNEISRARTFGFMSDVERLWKAGLALGANLNNTIAIGENKIMNREGLRYPQEFVRHKMLDAVGDLALAGKPHAGGLSARSAAAIASTRWCCRPCSPIREAWTDRPGSAGARAGRPVDMGFAIAAGE